MNSSGHAREAHRRSQEILLDDQGVAVSFRAPLAVQDETGKSMLEEKQAK